MWATDSQNVGVTRTVLGQPARRVEPCSPPAGVTLVLTLLSLVALYLAHSGGYFPVLRPSGSACDGISSHGAGSAAALAEAEARALLATDRYLTLLEGVVTTSLFPDLGACDGWNNCNGRWPYKAEDRLGGNDWAPHGLTMVGNLRIRNVRELIEQAVADSVPGDFVELGVWRGGVCMFARAQLDVLGQQHRAVYAFDAYGGIKTYATNMGFLEVPLETVQGTFERYGLLENVHFVKGMFSDTLGPWRDARGSKPIAVLRMDSNWYDGTTNALYTLYDLVPVGGFIVRGIAWSLSWARAPFTQTRTPALTSLFLFSPPLLVDFR